MLNISKLIASELGISDSRVDAVIRLIDEGSTIPFIARYRKEATGGLDDAVLRELDERLTYLRNLEARKVEVLRSIEEQGKLTRELRASIEDAQVMQRVEDLCKPFKKKRATRASKARAAGLEPLANLVLAQASGTVSALDAAAAYVNADGGYPTPEAALQGARGYRCRSDCGRRGAHRRHARFHGACRGCNGGSDRRRREDGIRAVLRLRRASETHTQSSRACRQSWREGGKAARARARRRRRGDRSFGSSCGAQTGTFRRCARCGNRR